MDKNTVIGFALIFLLLIGYTWYSQPSKEQQAFKKHQEDSIALVQKNKAAMAVNPSSAGVVNNSTTSNANLPTTVADSLNKLASGPFAFAAGKAEETKILENDVVKITLSSKGGTVKSVELKKYKTHNKQPLMLIDGNNNSFGFEFYAANNQLIKTKDLLFSDISESANSISFTLKTDSGAYIRQTYSLKKNDEYMVDYKVSVHGMQQHISNSWNSIACNWNQQLNLQEQEVKREQLASTIFYHYTNEDFDKLSESKMDEQAKPVTPVKWVSFKQTFFNTTLITDAQFTDAQLKQVAPVDSNAVMQMSAYLMLPYNHTADENYNMHFYFGPNKYNTLKSYNIGLEKVVSLGSGIFKWVKYINIWIFIPLFNFLNQFNLNYGIIILIIVLIIKLVMSPLSYKTFVSTAKMKVLKPELDDLRAKYKDDQAKFGAEQMKLYRKAGVSPLGGCLPQLIQIPIFIAMYNFFPSSIELRQQSFLWAPDLSSYDSILALGFNIPLYGNHISLFTLLMTVSSYITVFMNRNQMNMNSDPNMQAMKYMQYFFPIMFLGICNNLPAALSYYYLLQNLTSIIQQQVIQNFFINHDKLKVLIEENKKRPEKKSAFQTRLDEAYKMREQQAKGKKK